jgi:predicted acyltransferase
MSQRILSIDVFRALALIAIIIVNNPGSWDHVYPVLLESTWQGLSFADTLFPTFIFIMGMSIPFAIESMNNKQFSKQMIYRKIVQRVIALFIIGILYHVLANYLVLSHLRIPGVLQRIALVYGLCAISYMWVKNIRIYIVLGCIGLIIYWGLILFVTPGFVLNLNDPSANLGAYIDRLILGHYIYSTAGMYHGYDPESIFGTLSSYYNGMLGLAFGRLIYCYKSEPKQLIKSSLLIAIFSIVIGIIASIYIPIIKILWTPSFALITSGISGIYFIVIYYLFDYIKLATPIQPFLENYILPIGQHPLIIYGLEEVLIGTLIGIVQVMPGKYLELILFNALTNYLSPNLSSLISAFVCVIIIMLIARLWLIKLKK